MYLLLFKDVKTELSKVRRVERQIPSVGGIRAEGRGRHLDLALSRFSWTLVLCSERWQCPIVGVLRVWESTCCLARLLVGGRLRNRKGQRILFPKEFGVLTPCTQKVDTQDWKWDNSILIIITGTPLKILSHTIGGCTAPSYTFMTPEVKDTNSINPLDMDRKDFN